VTFIFKNYVYIDSPRGCCRGTCIYRAFIRLTLFPLLFTHSLSPCFPNIQQLTVQCIILYSFIDELFQYFSFSNIFLSLPPKITFFECHVFFIQCLFDIWMTFMINLIYCLFYKQSILLMYCLCGCFSTIIA
jgi:hypothetical protein